MFEWTLPLPKVAFIRGKFLPDVLSPQRGASIVIIGGLELDTLTVVTQLIAPDREVYDVA